MTAVAPALSAGRRSALNRRVRWIVGATIAYNVVEAGVAIAAGIVASSTALVAFGLDSIVEVGSAAAIAWQFSAPDPRTREHLTLRLVAWSFFLLAAYVGYEAISSLLAGATASPSRVGIGLAVASVAIMPTLSWLERRTGRELGSGSVVADSKQTLICAALSAVLLLGLLANATVGWAWADPLAALVIAAVAAREGFAALRGDTCCAPAATLVHADADTCCAGDCECV